MATFSPHSMAAAEELMSGFVESAANVVGASGFPFQMDAFPFAVPPHPHERPHKNDKKPSCEESLYNEVKSSAEENMKKLLRVQSLLKDDESADGDYD